MIINFGSYVGNGAARSIVTDHAPNIVFVKGTGVTDTWCKTSTMAGANSATLLGALFAANHITALNADGFSVGTDAAVNASGTTYYWVAIQTEASDSKVGSYVGDGTDNRDITGIGFLPDAVLSLSEEGYAAGWRTSEMPSGQSMQLQGTGLFPNRIQALQADGFQVGADLSVNKSGITYHYIALQNVGVKCSTIAYTGDGADNRAITGVGFQPSFVMTEPGNNQVGVAALRFLSQIGDASSTLNGAETTNLIQAFQPDGFQVGTGSSVNGGGRPYYALALGGSQPDRRLGVVIIRVP